MDNNKLKALAAAKAKVTQLEQAISAERSRELATLPAQYGFADVNSFVAAVKAASSKPRGRKPGAAKSAAPKKRKRAKITDAVRAKVKKLVESGKTGAAIAKVVGISLPSVQNIKKALGLVGKKRSNSRSAVTE